MFDAIKRFKDGIIKDFTVPDPHTVYCTAYLVTATEPFEKMVKKESVIIPELPFMYKLHAMVDPEDGRVFGEKWVLTNEVIKELLSKGTATQFIQGHPLRFEYYIRPTKHASELRHKG